MTYPTSQKLADAIAAEPCAPEYEERRQIMVAGARTDHYHEFFGHTATPIIQLVADLAAIGMHALAARAAQGEFDATKEESDAWAASPESQASFGALAGNPLAVLRGQTQEEELRRALPPEALPEAIERLCQFSDGLLNGEQTVQPRYGFVLLVGEIGSGTGRTAMKVATNIERENMKMQLGKLLEKMNAPEAATVDLAFVQPQGRG